MVDLDFADDVAPLSSTKMQHQGKTTRLEEEAKRVGLKINTGKTKTLRMNAGNQEKIKINDKEIKDVDQFTYCT